ncbi:MFS transporter [Streptomyces sp. NPDC052309]|uniref:MFS transporter n=1 Tax=Streptomyces griseicoloratus TaxID=2752516 RepID=A0A926LB77_9ACTN|nr:MFS transporter [Streptomyces griseicoloratus]MBD0423651.1 MFS transporter [Streptomyces griseicoloratus]
MPDKDTSPGAAAEDSSPGESAEAAGPVSPGTDRAFSVVTTTLFSVSLGMVSVAAPVIAVQAGISTAAIGLLVALSGVSQIATRLCMGPLLRRFPDKLFVAFASGALAVSCALLVRETAMWAFAVSQLLQGLARALFWTGTQTHAIRAWPTSVGGLTVINIANGVGALVGPVLAGALAVRSLSLSLVVATVMGVLGLVSAALLRSFRPFRSAPQEKGNGRRRLWLRPGVGAACAMTAGGGAWKGLMNSYVPVVLSHAGHAAPAVGALVTGANLAGLMGSAVSKRVQAAGLRPAMLLGLVPAGVGIGLTGLFPGSIVVATAMLFAAGLGAGVLQTVGPALAADSVGPEERGDAIATIGTFRAATLLAAPLGAGALVLVMSAGAALATAGALMSLPAVLVSLRNGPTEKHVRSRH